MHCIMDKILLRQSVHRAKMLLITHMENCSHECWTLTNDTFIGGYSANSFDKSMCPDYTAKNIVWYCASRVNSNPSLRDLTCSCRICYLPFQKYTLLSLKCMALYFCSCRFCYLPFQVLKRNGFHGPIPSYFYGNYKSLEDMVSVCKTLVSIIFRTCA